jgi:hypothetical protein
VIGKSGSTDIDFFLKLGQAFQLSGKFIEAVPYGSGHINDTYAASYDRQGRRVRYIYQRINHLVFNDPPGLMENIHRVTRHQHKHLIESGASDPSRRALTVLPADGDLPYFTDPAKNFWRCYLFIENAKTYDVIESSAQAYQAARAFGEFQKVLADLPGNRLRESIPKFHDTAWRFENLEAAVATDPAGRLSGCRAEADFALAQKAKIGRLAQMLAGGQLPERVTHNDTKLNNVMMDDSSGEGLCVIDLDTVMPGLAAYDFGDMVRTATMPCKEDDTDLSKISMQWDKFEALARGYLSSAGAFLTQAEKESLAFGGWLITFEIGIRFLTDHLTGDRYFKIQRPHHNLDRCRTQFALARDIDKNLGRMGHFIEGL